MRIFPLAEEWKVDNLDGLLSINMPLQTYLKTQDLEAPLTIPSGYHNCP